MRLALKDAARTEADAEAVLTAMGWVTRPFCLVNETVSCPADLRGVVNSWGAFSSKLPEPLAGMVQQSITGLHGRAPVQMPRPSATGAHRLTHLLLQIADSHERRNFLICALVGRRESSWTKDMSELTDLYVNLLKAWNVRDAKAMAACFGDDAVMIGFDGSAAEGKVAIEDHLAPIFRDHPTAAYTAILRSEHDYGDTRLLRADAGMVPPDMGNIKSETMARQTLVARRTDAGLRIVLFQNTAITLDQDKARREAVYGESQRAHKSGEILRR